MKVILAQQQKLKQYQKESKKLFWVLLPRDTLCHDFKKSISWGGKMFTKKWYAKAKGTSNPVKLHLHWNCTQGISEAYSTISAGGVRFGALTPTPSSFDKAVGMTGMSLWLINQTGSITGFLLSSLGLGQLSQGPQTIFTVIRNTPESCARGAGAGDRQMREVLGPQGANVCWREGVNK